MTATERTKWVLWSVRNDPDIDKPTGQEKIAAFYIGVALRQMIEDAALVVDSEAASKRKGHTRNALRLAARRIRALTRSKP